MYISLVSLSSGGDLMCTVDVKLPEDELGGLVTLKFWNHGSRAGQFHLSTIIYEPHRLAQIISGSDRYILVLCLLTCIFDC
jgi:NET1-associated nuclear protein 1 (U3 small nucleolar RNA-associated protein 17)